MERECVKIASDNPAFPKGYYIQFKDKMKSGDVIYGAPILTPYTAPVIPETIPANHEEPKPIKRKVRK